MSGDKSNLLHISCKRVSVLKATIRKSFLPF